MTSYTRRNFLKLGAAGAAGLAITPALLTSCLPPKNKKRDKKPAANGKIDMAFIGIGFRGNEDFKGFIGTEMINVIALCDVDMGAPHTTEVIDMFPDVPRYKDFRIMLDEIEDKIDAVCIATPDFSHFAICIDAMRRGINVYVEKPLARTFMECELLMAAEKKYGVVTQMGNQGHSEGNYYQFKAWKEAGIIKDVTAITAHMNNSRRWHSWDPKMTEYPVGDNMPKTMDWDVWKMQTHDRAYHDNFHRGQWRCWYEYGMGALGDWGAHLIDTCHEFLELGLPDTVEPLYLKDHNPFFFPMSSTLKFHFPARGEMPPVDLTWYDGLDNIPEVPEGYGVSEIDPNVPAVAGGKIKPAKLNPGKEIYSKTLTFKGASHGSTLSIIPESKAKEMEALLPEVPAPTSNHYSNFLKAIKGEEEAHSRFSISAPLSEVFCLGVIAQWTGRKIVFDREKKQITNDPLANQLLWGPTPRAGWEKYYMAD
ncbi:MAG: Gfo/Idh/MocA family oxidoreductase [Bacteroidales bacterium]|nr:Gfo/Idh/MocA family oxidoreductase [Bacteroidales bacterium]